MNGMPIKLIISLVFFAALVLLQIYLSKREDKISGLILPILTFLWSLGVLVDLWGYDVSILQMLMIIAFRNIPTIIFIAIYILCRKRNKINKEIEKMNIQDL